MCVCNYRDGTIIKISTTWLVIGYLASSIWTNLRPLNDFKCPLIITRNVLLMLTYYYRG